MLANFRLQRLRRWMVCASRFRPIFTLRSAAHPAPPSLLHLVVVGLSRTAAFGKANAQHPWRAAPSADTVVRPPSNTNAIDIHSRTYPFLPPTPGTAAT